MDGHLDPISIWTIPKNLMFYSQNISYPQVLSNRPKNSTYMIIEAKHSHIWIRRYIFQSRQSPSLWGSVSLLHSGKLTWRFGRCFSFLIDCFSRFHAHFQGCKFQGVHPGLLKLTWLLHIFFGGQGVFLGCTWRIIPVSKWLVTPIYEPFRPFRRGTTPT